MTLRDLIQALRRSLRAIVALTLCGAIGGLVAYSTSAPTYQSTVDFFIATPVQTAGNPTTASQFAIDRLQSYAQLLDSDYVAQGVIKATGVDLSTKDIRDRISTQAKANVVVLTANVTDNNPDRSLLLARGLATSFTDAATSLDNSGAVKPVQVNVISGPSLVGKVGPSLVKTVLPWLVAGFVLGLVLAISRQLVAPRLSAKELAEDREIAVLGQVSNVGLPGNDAPRRRAHANDYLEPYRQLGVRLNGLLSARARLLIASTGAKENSAGVAAGVATAESDLQRRVVLVDADLRGRNLSVGLGLQDSDGLANVLDGTAVLAEVLKAQPSGATFLPAGSLTGRPIELASRQAMTDLLVQLGNDYDLVVVHGSPLATYADTAVVASGCTDAILVVGDNKENPSRVSAAVTTLKSTSARFLGIVATAGRPSQSGTYAPGRYAANEPARGVEAAVEP